ncbi:MAG: hypothetical protein ABI321_22975 [Polyangia bacterium]
MIRTPLALCLGALCLWLAAPAQAGEHLVCTVRVIQAGDAVTAAQGTEPVPKLDPRIDRLRSFLLKPPFTAWRTFELLDSKTLDVVEGVPQSFTLPNQKVATLTLVQHLPDTGGKHHRLRMQLELGKGTPNSLKTVFVIDEGGLVLQAGQPHRHGILVLGTSCNDGAEH